MSDVHSKIEDNLWKLKNPTLDVFGSPTKTVDKPLCDNVKEWFGVETCMKCSCYQTCWCTE